MNPHGVRSHESMNRSTLNEKGLRVNTIQSIGLRLKKSSKMDILEVLA